MEGTTNPFVEKLLQHTNCGEDCHPLGPEEWYAININNAKKKDHGVCAMCIYQVCIILISILTLAGSKGNRIVGYVVG